MQPQVLRLRLADKADQTPLRMTALFIYSMTALFIHRLGRYRDGAGSVYSLDLSDAPNESYGDRMTREEAQKTQMTGTHSRP